MKETPKDYLFHSLIHDKLVAFTKNNYKKHLPRHPFIAGKEGLSSIEDTLLNPQVITHYTRKDHNVGYEIKCQAFYRILKRKNIGGDKFILDYWQVIMVNNTLYKRWEIATALYEENSLEYAMINTRIESILHDYRNKQ